ncbi:uncharacterized protein LOC144655868 isoform X3 [Oculina patagonica]
MLANISGSMFAPRMDSRGEQQFAEFRSREPENSRRADVRHKPFIQPVYRTANRSKDLDSRQTITPVDRHNGGNRPEFTSLADVYEGALRNVLGIQLHLALDDQQSFTQDAINDLLFRDKSSSANHRGLRQDQKRRSENHLHGRPGDENKDMKSLGSFQGRTLLRDPRRVSQGGSAFHVPPKKARLDEDMPYPERGFPVDHYGVAPGMNFPPDYANSFPSSKGSPGIYHRRVNAPEAITHVYGTNGIHIPSPRERYSLWSFGHHRDIATVFPVRCSSVESDRRYHHGVLEEERRRNMSLARVNGFMHGKPAVQVKIEKETKDESIKREQKSSSTERRSSATPAKEAGLEIGTDKEKLSPSSSPKSKPAYSTLTSYRSSPTNGAVDFRMETRFRSAQRKLETRRDGRKGKGEDAKEEFLFKLGLERIEA